MDEKGYVLTNKILFSNLSFYVNNLLNDFTKDDYEKVLSKNFFKVLDIAVDNSSYLILVNDKKTGQYIFDLDSRDVKIFLPIKIKAGFIVPTNLTFEQELKYIFELIVDSEFLKR